jgi:CDP-glycerol glycerophosphotransferase (TagB/SpsB family)
MKNLSMASFGKRFGRKLLIIISKAFSVLVGAYWMAVYGERLVTVVGGHSGDAFDDNSRAMAEYLSEIDTHIVFWVYRKDEVRNAARAAGIRTLRRGSILAEAIVRLSNVLMFSHGESDISVFPLSNVSEGFVVYLGHGVWGLKRVERRKGVERPKTFDATIAASECEARIKARALGVDESCVIRCGIPKHDRFVRRHTIANENIRSYKSVLVFLTWRDWLQYKPSDSAIFNYTLAINKLMQAMPRTDLCKGKLRANFVLHRNIRHLKDTIVSSLSDLPVDVNVSSNVDIGVLLSDSDYLVSDYSAVIWDFLVQGKPVSRYVYDKEIYDFLIGGYPEIERFLDSVTFRDPEDVWTNLFSDQAELVRRVRRHVIPYSDGHSCEKLASQVVESLLRRPTRLRSVQ